MPEELAAFPEDVDGADQQTAQLPPGSARPPDGADATEAPAPDTAQVSETIPGVDFTHMTIAELLQLDLVLPEGAIFGEDVMELPQGDAEVVDLMELSLLELMSFRVTAEAQPELPDLNPDGNLLPPDDEGIWQGPPSHLSPEGGLTPIGVLPGTDYIPAPPPPPPPPDPGTNDPPSAKNDSYTVAEGSKLAVTSKASGLLGNDSDDASSPQISSVGSAIGTVTITNKLTGTFNYSQDGNFEYLAAGEKATDVFTYTIVDNKGLTDTATATITITGKNDGPTITSGAQAGAATEIADKAPGENGNTHQDSGTVTFADIDLADTHDAAFAPKAASYLGTFALDAVDQAGDGVDWTFKINDSALDFLAEGETLTQTYTVTVDDKNGGSAAQDVVVTLTGKNDAPTIASAPTSGSVAERVDGAKDENAVTHTAKGTVSFADVDVSDTHTASVNDPAGYLGDLTVAIDQATNTVQWTFKVDDTELDSLPAKLVTQTYTLQVDDGNGGAVTQMITVNITGANDAPSAADDDNASDPVVEDGDATAAGNVLANDTDVDAGDVLAVTSTGTLAGTYGDLLLNADGTWTYTLNNADADTDALADGQTVTDTFTYTVGDKAGATDTATIKITITGENDAPTDIALSAATVAENDAGAVIGTLTTTDPDAGDSHTYGVSDARFEVVGGQLQLKAGVSLDFEAEPTVSIDVTATDAGGLDVTETFVIAVTDKNEAPTDIALSAATVAENDAGAVIGTLTTTDPDAGDSHTYGVSDARFEVVGGQLQLKSGVSLDFEAEPTVSIDVTATDAGGLDVTETFVIAVTDKNEAPTDIALSAATVAENDAGAVIGTLTTTDPDAGDSHTYGVSDARFEVVGGQLQLKSGVSLDFEAEPTVSIDVTATDAGGLDVTETFVIAVTNKNEAPTDIALSAATVAENDAGAVIGTLSTTDPDAGDSHTYGVSDARFEVVGGQLQLKSGVSLDFEAEPTVSIDVTATDAGGLDVTETFVIAVTNKNEAPTDIALSAATVAENDAGAVIGTLTTTDPDAGDSHTYGVSDARFEVVGGQLQLKSGVSLDFEAEPTVSIDVTATDAGGLDVTETFVIAVTDEDPENVVGDGGANQLIGGAGNDTLSGAGGNDTLVGGAGADSLSGGADDDTLAWDAADLSIDGGTGSDILLVDAGTLDLATAAGILSGIETVDLGNANGNNTLTLTEADVISTSDTDSLTILGGAGDKLEAGTGWADGGEAGGFHTYTKGAATLVVDTSITVNPDILT